MPVVKVVRKVIDPVAPAARVITGTRNQRALGPFMLTVCGRIGLFWVVVIRLAVEFPRFLTRLLLFGTDDSLRAIFVNVPGFQDRTGQDWSELLDCMLPELADQQQLVLLRGSRSTCLTGFGATDAGGMWRSERSPVLDCRGSPEFSPPNSRPPCPNIGVP